jgi:hypothetical protein
MLRFFSESAVNLKFVLRKAVKGIDLKTCLFSLFIYHHFINYVVYLRISKIVMIGE